LLQKNYSLSERNRSAAVCNRSSAKKHSPGRKNPKLLLTV
jgi:hypothetical protein